MEKIKIEASELTTEEVSTLEKEANNLLKEYNYSLHEIMIQFLGLEKNLMVSLYLESEKTAVFKCRKNTMNLA